MIKESRLDRKILLVLVCLLTLHFLQVPLSASDRTVRICNDIGEWPPYFYYERHADGTKSDKLVGATVDSLDAIFKRIGIEYEFDLIPWQRCLTYVDNFHKTKKYEMFSEAGINTWRKERYLNTREPVYKRTNVFYYNTAKYPGGIKIKTVTDMEQYRICVATGLSFERYVKAGLNKALVNTNHQDYFEVLRMISLERCDIMPANLAIIEGAERVNRFTLPSNVSYIPDATIEEPFYYHYWIARSSPRASMLQTRIDQAIKALKASGEWERIYQKYLSNGSGLQAW
ncbi:MAG: hypothetical protein D3926_16890 [Desulfobacteraceae bacterium]|nr:MAG: hypothetical protein D3926_16890 [Desulfobacteraceae bacterium]